MNDGGPAFPRPSGEAVDMIGNHFWPQAQEGMSLRDYFAAAALQGMLAYSYVNPQSGNYHENCTATAAANTAFDFADAMIAARNK